MGKFFLCPSVSRLFFASFPRLHKFALFVLLVCDVLISSLHMDSAPVLCNLVVPDIASEIPCVNAESKPCLSPVQDGLCDDVRLGGKIAELLQDTNVDYMYVICCFFSFDSPH